MVLRFKGLAYRAIDALALEEHDRLVEVNPRAEVPVLVHGSVSVRDSTDIVYYLEDRFPEPTVLPGSPQLRGKARRWQRLADTVLDAVIHDISLWTWPTHHRSDRPPGGLLEAGRRDGISRCSPISRLSSRSAFFSKKRPTRSSCAGIARCAVRRPYGRISSM
jgi:glutathione S-transferase